MEQHPIPQQISSYEFKLVGEMTLKQFLKAAGGIVIALLLSATHLIFFIKWPLELIFAAGGLVLAFVPFQDRPMETWVKAYIKSIYSPTIYTYKKKASDNWLEIHPSREIEEDKKNKEDVIPKKDEAKVKEFITSLPSIKKEESAEEAVITEVGPKIKEEIKTEGKATTQAANSEAAEMSEENWREQKANLGLKSEKLSATGRAEFGEIPMPDIPSVPNLIVGMVTDTYGKIVEGAIIEIQDELGNPSRVIKTNPLGQFKITTQLANGKYLIITEKEGLKFDRVDVILNGQIVKPIRIRAFDEPIA
ncbi:MAG TPA: PrgI family protein [Patescibacteria group bacterium]